MNRHTKVLIASLIVSQLAFMVPWLVFGGLDSNPLSSAALLAAMSIVTATVLGDLRLAALLALPLAIASGLAVLWADIPPLAGLVVGLATFGRGLLSQRGIQNAPTLAIISLVFLIAEPPAAADTGSMPRSLAVSLVVLASAAWPLLLLWLGRSHLPKLPRKPVDSQHALWFAIVTAVLTTAATWVVSAAHLAHAGAWFVMTILIVMQPFARDSFDKSLARGAGTAVGFVVAFGIGWLIDGRPDQTVIASSIGGLAMLVAVFLMLTKRPYWSFAIFITLAIVLLEGASSSIVHTDVLRLVATLAGVAVAVGITTMLAPLGRRMRTARADTASQK